MQTVTEQVQILPYEMLASFVVVLFILFGAVLTIDKVLDVIRKWRKPKEAKGKALADQQAKCAKMFRADDERMNKMEAQLTAMRQEMEQRKEGERVIIAGVRELLEHELHNGNGKAMKEASDDLFSYLNRK